MNINGGGIATTPGDPLYRGIGREVNERLGYGYVYLTAAQREANSRAVQPDLWASLDRIKREKGWS